MNPPMLLMYSTVLPNLHVNVVSLYIYGSNIFLDISEIVDFDPIPLAGTYKTHRASPTGKVGARESKGIQQKVIPQIAIAIGVLISNRGEGDEPLWRIGRGTRVPLQGAVDVVPLLGAIVGCHCSVLWLRGRVTTNFGGADVVPLLGAIAGFHCSVLWWGEEGDDQLWGSGRGAIAGCHCRVPL